MYHMKGPSERKVKTHEAINYLSRVFSEEKKESGGTASDRTMAKVMALFDGRGRGAELASSKGTALWLAQLRDGVCYHERRARSADHRLDSAWFGQGSALKERALDQTLVMIV